MPQMKRALLTTSQCRRDLWERDQEGNRTGEYSGHEPTPLLRWLVEHGYKIDVITGRSALLWEMDGCWVPKVEVVYFTGALSPVDPHAIQTATRMAERMGLPYRAHWDRWDDIFELARQAGWFCGRADEYRGLGIPMELYE